MSCTHFWKWQWDESGRGPPLPSPWIKNQKDASFLRETGVVFTPKKCEGCWKNKTISALFSLTLELFEILGRWAVSGSREQHVVWHMGCGIWFGSLKAVPCLQVCWKGDPLGHRRWGLLPSHGEAGHHSLRHPRASEFTLKLVQSEWSPGFAQKSLRREFLSFLLGLPLGEQSLIWAVASAAEAKDGEKLVILFKSQNSAMPVFAISCQWISLFYLTVMSHL